MTLKLPRAMRLGALLAIGAVVAVPMAVASDVAQVEPLSPAPSAETGQMTAEVPGAWFVELSGKPLAAGGSAAELKAEKDAFRAAAKKAGFAFTERYSFDTLWNGLSIQTRTADATKLLA